MAERKNNIGMHMNGESIWNVVNILGQGVPIEMALRELVQNAFEACERASDDLNKRIRVNKNSKGELTVINSGGDFFSLEVAKKHLNTLGSSGNSSNLTNNFGIGAKISVLANNHEISYISKKANEETGVSFTIGTVNDKTYGLKNFKEARFTVRDYPNTVTAASITSETDNTWDIFNEAVSPKNGVSGWGIARFLSTRYFKTRYKTEVATYNKEGRVKYRRVHGALHLMQNTKRYGSFELSGGSIPAGTVAHWCVLDEKNSNRNKMLGDYFLGFSLKDELLTNLNESFQHRTIDFTKCGVFSSAARLIVIFELPEDSGFIWSGDRSVILSHDSKKPIKCNDFYAAFKKQLPEKIKELQIQKEYELDIDKLHSDIAKEFKDFFMPSLGPSPSGNKKKPKKPKNPPTGATRSPSGGNSFKFNIDSLPALEHSNNKDAPIVSFLADSNAIVVNHESPIFKFRKNKIMQGQKNYSILPELEIDGNIREEVFRGAVYSMIEFFMIEGKEHTPSEVEEFLTSDKLDCWGMTNYRAVRVRLGHRLTRFVNSLDT